MKFKSKKCDVSSQPGQFFSHLPYEMQESILLQVINDPKTTFDDLKALRLVCKLFNEIIAPRVLFCLAMFKYPYTILGNIRQFLALSSSRQHSDLNAAKMLTIQTWEWNYHGPFMSYRSLPHIGLLIKANLMLSGFYCIKFLFRPKILPISIYHGTLQICGRICLSRTPRINLPNIRSVVWKIRRGDPKWILYHTVKLFLQFPELEELSLVVDQEQYEFNYFIECACKLRTLRKLKITLHYTRRRFDMPREYEINKLGKIIAANPGLTHLDLVHFSRAEQHRLSDIFRHVPSDRPLKLEHLGISEVFDGSYAIIPHIRSLTSCDFPNSHFLQPLLSEEVYPPIMGIGGTDDLTITYLTRHPRITSLTLHNFPKHEDLARMLKVLLRHSETLTYLKISGSSFIQGLEDGEIESLLLQYRNLKQLVLVYPHYDMPISSQLEKMLSTFSRLGQSLTLAFTSHVLLRKCLEHCERPYIDPSLRDLARRMVFARPHGVEQLFGTPPV